MRTALFASSMGVACGMEVGLHLLRSESLRLGLV